MRPPGRQNQQLQDIQKHATFLPQEHYVQISEISQVGL